MATRKELESKINKLNNKLAEIARENTPSKENPTGIMPREYYNTLREKQNAEAELRQIATERKAEAKTETKTFVNAFGEAATREITTAAYKRSQKALEKQLLGWM